MAAPQDPERERTTTLCELVVGVVLDVNGELLQEIEELCQQGIEVDENNDPSPKNAKTSAPATQTIGQWATPIICHRREDVNCRNTKGLWRLQSWPKHSEMTELSLYRMAYPEQWMWCVFVPATNTEISGDNITLQELYVYLGCQFFMACFEGISDRRLY